MRRLVAAGSLVFVWFGCVSQAAAQQAMVRGLVIDESGQPIPEVKVVIECMQDNRPRRFTRTTDKKGGYVQVGLPGGPCKLSLTKPGYQPRTVDAHISLGGLSELPDITLKASPALAAPAPPPSGAAPTATPTGSVTGEPAAAALDATQKVKESFAAAKEAIKAGRLEEAEGLYKSILETTPGMASAHFNLGVVYRQKKDWVAAEAAFTKAIELEPDSSEGYAALAGVYELSGQQEKALELLTRAGSRFEQDPRFQYQLGISSLNAGRPDAAMAALQKVVTLDPSNVEAHFYLGTVAVGKNDIPAAIAHLEKYVSLTGQNPQNLVTAERLLAALTSGKS